MYFVERLLARIIDLFTLISAIALALMMIQITADVIGKNLFNHPLPGTISTVSQYYMIIVSFLPLALVERSNGHISVEVITEKLSMTVQQKLGFLATLLSAAVFAILTWRAFQEAITKYNIGTFIYEQGVKITTWPSYFLLPLGTGLMTLVLIYKAVRFIRKGEFFDTTAQFESDATTHARVDNN